ncbi:MAG: hypothetical protein JO076_14340 [Verrucomicrobia bacterium]|nr:hypothetical protein [Verrucomicrobiota bacterium]
MTTETYGPDTLKAGETKTWGVPRTDEKVRYLVAVPDTNKIQVSYGPIRTNWVQAFAEVSGAGSVAGVIGPATQESLDYIILSRTVHWRINFTNEDQNHPVVYYMKVCTFDE